MRLGVELDSFDGHHYISTVAPDGPVAKHGLLRPEDELLEVQKGTRTLIHAFTGSVLHHYLFSHWHYGEELWSGGPRAWPAYRSSFWRALVRLLSVPLITQ